MFFELQIMSIEVDRLWIKAYERFLQMEAEKENKDRNSSCKVTHKRKLDKNDLHDEKGSLIQF